jgi:hypothetical protein
MPISVSMAADETKPHHVTFADMELQVGARLQIVTFNAGKPV